MWVTPWRSAKDITVIPLMSPLSCSSLLQPGLLVHPVVVHQSEEQESDNRDSRSAAWESSLSNATWRLLSHPSFCACALPDRLISHASCFPFLFHLTFDPTGSCCAAYQIISDPSCILSPWSWYYSTVTSIALLHRIVFQSPDDPSAFNHGLKSS